MATPHDQSSALTLASYQELKLSLPCKGPSAAHSTAISLLSLLPYSSSLFLILVAATTTLATAAATTARALSDAIAAKKG
jgi:hypothetical protein